MAAQIVSYLFVFTGTVLGYCAAVWLVVWIQDRRKMRDRRDYDQWVQMHKETGKGYGPSAD